MFESINQSFNSIFSKNLTGSLKKAVRGVCSSENNTVLSFLASQLTSVRNSVDRSNQVIQLFSLCADTISASEDALITHTMYDIQEISDRRDLIIEGCKFISERYGDMTFTDSFGLLYNLIFRDIEFEDASGRHIHSYLSTTAAPNDVRDCIFYSINGSGMYINAIVRTADFMEPPEFGASNLYDNVRAYCVVNDDEFNGTILNGYDGTIQSYLQSLGGTAATLLDMSEEIVPTLVASGKVRYLWDLVKEYMMSSELNSVIADALASLSQGVTGLISWMTTISAQIVNKVDCVKQFFNGLCNAYTSGGFKGAMMYLYEYFKTASSATDENGLLKFTNNSNLVPTEYVVGMIGQVVSTAVAAAGAIVTFFQPIIGVLVSMIGGVAYGLFKSIDYDASATRCAIQTSDKVAINAAPYAIAQGEIALNQNSDLFTFVNTTPIFILEVPGGYLLCGPGEYSNSTVVKLRYEFHPSLENRIDAIATLAGQVCDISSSSGTVQGTFTIWYKTAGSYVDLNYGLLNAWINTVYCQESSLSSYIMSNQSDDHLSVEDDELMRKIICCNIWLFMYWVSVYTMTDKAHVHRLNPVSYPSEDFFFSYSRTPLGVETIGLQADDFENALITLAPVPGTDCFINLDIEWASIVSGIISRLANKTYLNIPVNYAIVNGIYMGNPIAVPSTFDYALVPAQYNAGTFLTWIIMSALVTVAVATVTVAVTFKVRKTIQTKRAEQNKRVENAWEAYRKGEISYDDYRKTVKTANRWQKLVGGTKYDYENYWNGDTSVSPASTSDSHATLSGIRAMLNGDQNVVAVNGEQLDVNELLTMTLKAIVG